MGKAEILTVCISVSILGFFLKGIQPPFNSVCSGSAHWFNTGNSIKVFCLSLFFFLIIQVSLNIGLLCLYISSENGIGFLSVSVLGTP